MRSIGKINIKKLDKIVSEEYQKMQPYGFNHSLLDQNINNRIPAQWHDIHESAWSEIHRIISDKITALKYNKK